MTVDPTAAMWSEGGLLFVAWEDLAASLVLHNAVMATVHAQLGERLALAMPTRSTFILGVRGRHEDRISELGRDVLARAGTANQLSNAIFTIERGVVIDQAREL